MCWCDFWKTFQVLDFHTIIDEAEDPAATPVFWISKWVDYSDKYGLGYQLSDNSVGVWFNDFSRMILNGNGEYGFNVLHIYYVICVSQNFLI